METFLRRGSLLSIYLSLSREHNFAQHLNCLRTHAQFGTHVFGVNHDRRYVQGTVSNFFIPFHFSASHHEVCQRHITRSRRPASCLSLPGCLQKSRKVFLQSDICEDIVPWLKENFAAAAASASFVEMSSRSGSLQSVYLSLVNTTLRRGWTGRWPLPSFSHMCLE